MTRTRFLEPQSGPPLVNRAPLLLTNDDGVGAPGLMGLARALHQRGHPLAVLAPLTEQSASGMKLTLRSDMNFQEHDDLANEVRNDESIPLRFFSLDGSPCDCVIVALDGGLQAWAPDISPCLCISGINHGPNLSVDVLHSGTVSAAREAALYGMPSMAVSLATYSHEDFSQALEATIRLVDAISPHLPKAPPNLRRPEGSRLAPEDGSSAEAIWSSFLMGNLFLNMNVPEIWNGGFRTVDLGARWYHNATDMHDKENMGVAFEVGAATIEDEDIPNTDCNAVKAGYAALTPLASWPRNHPSGISDSLLEAATLPGGSGLPAWL